MAHTYTNLLTHVIFSRKGRAPHIDAELRGRLLPYLGGIIRELGGKTRIVNCEPDHVHMLATLPPKLAVADALRVLKTNSSRWVHEQWPSRRAFAWQTGYSAFSVSESNAEAVAAYIEGQGEHHRKVTFQQEYLAFLTRHGIEYDQRHVWD